MAIGFSVFSKFLLDTIGSERARVRYLVSIYAQLNAGKIYSAQSYTQEVAILAQHTVRP
jgi:hypothetical protein